jgi:hypothetical protein
LKKLLPALFVALVLLGSGRALSEGRALVPTDGVRDPVFAVLLGFVLDDHVGTLDSTTIRSEVEKIKRKPKLPYRMIAAVTRTPATIESRSSAEGGTNGQALDLSAVPSTHLVTSRFTSVIDLPVPYQILGYHPGSFQGNAELHFEEIPIGTRRVPHFVEEDGKVMPRPFTIDEARIYLLVDGALDVDIHGWLDRLAGGKLDDTRLAAIIVFRKDSKLYGMAIGYNRKGQPRSGTIAFAEDKILYPNSPDLKAVAREMRREIEEMSPGLPAHYTGW